MAADDTTIRTTIENYTGTFTKGDREAWLDLFADGATMEDPVGTPLKTSGTRSVTSTTRARHGRLGRTAPDRFPIVVGDQAAFAFDVRPTIGGNTLVIPAIDVMTFDDDARSRVSGHSSTSTRCGRPGAELRTNRPGNAPVGSPDRYVSTPLTNVCR